MNPILSVELAKAWAEKANRLAEKLAQMEDGFALFRPEAVDRTRNELDRAIFWARYWAVQA